MSKQLTGEQIHAAYNHMTHKRNQERLKAGSKYFIEPIRLWNELQPTQKQFFDGMAAYLNTLPVEQKDEGTP